MPMTSTNPSDALTGENQQSEIERLRAELDGAPPLLFLANLIHERQCRDQGYTCATLWLCTREDIQQACLAEARQAIAAWWENEKAAARRREVGAARYLRKGDDDDRQGE
jgi:hypothetical protein